MVTRDTPWLPGTPSWVDVTVDDVPKAVAFYQALFGWDIQSGGPQTGRSGARTGWLVDLLRRR